jgi:hypothetical protein
MDRTISWLTADAVHDPLERALVEIDVAIALILAGAAVTVQLCGLEAAERAAATGAARAQAAGLAFQLRRDPPASGSLIIGPRLRAVANEIVSATRS